MQARILTAKRFFGTSFWLVHKSASRVGTGILTGRNVSSSQRTQTASQIHDTPASLSNKTPRVPSPSQMLYHLPPTSNLSSSPCISQASFHSGALTLSNIISTLRGQQKAKSVYTSRQPGREFKALPLIAPLLSHSVPFSPFLFLSVVSSLSFFSYSLKQGQQQIPPRGRDPGGTQTKHLIPLVERSREMVTFPTLVSLPCSEGDMVQLWQICYVWGLL